MEHGLKDIAFYVQKHITPCTVVITSLLVHDKPLGAPTSVKRVYCGTYQHPSMIYLSNHSIAKLTLNMQRNFWQLKHRCGSTSDHCHLGSESGMANWLWLKAAAQKCSESTFLILWYLIHNIFIYYMCICMEQEFSWSQMIIEFAWEVSSLAWRVSQSQNGGTIFVLTKWSPKLGSVVFD